MEELPPRADEEDRVAELFHEREEVGGDDDSGPGAGPGHEGRDGGGDGHGEDGRRSGAARAQRRSSLDRGESMYVLDPGESATIRGWRTSLDQIRQFVFVNEERSYAEELAGAAKKAENAGALLRAAPVLGRRSGQAVRLEAQRLLRHPEHAVALLGDDLRVRGHARQQQEGRHLLALRVVLVEVPELQALLRHVCREGFEHHAAVNGPSQRRARAANGDQERYYPFP